MLIKLTSLLYEKKSSEWDAKKVVFAADTKPIKSKAGIMKISTADSNKDSYKVTIGKYNKQGTSKDIADFINSTLKLGKYKSNIIDGERKSVAIKKLYRLVHPYTTHLYHDNAWEGVYKIWDTFRKEGINIQISPGKYRNYLTNQTKSDVSPWKEYPFTILYDNNKGNTVYIDGMLRANAAGTIKDPFDRYDITVSFY